MKTWHHGHSLGSGLVLGLLLSRHGGELIGLGVVVGLLAASAQRAIRAIVWRFRQRIS